MFELAVMSVVSTWFTALLLGYLLSTFFTASPKQVKIPCIDERML